MFLFWDEIFSFYSLMNEKNKYTRTHNPALYCIKIEMIEKQNHLLLVGQKYDF